MPKQLLSLIQKQKLAQKKGPNHGGVPVPDVSVSPQEKGVARRSGGGSTGGGAGSHRIDFPYVGTGRLPIKTRGGPSMSFDVNASELMQNFIMNDDDKEWYKKLFKKQNKFFLEPRFSVQNGMDTALGASRKRLGDMLSETDHRVVSFGFFIPVPPQMVRKIEAVYPEASQRAQKDDSPLHATVLYVGDLDERQVEGAINASRAVLQELEPFSVNVEGTGYFHNDDASVFHIRVAAPELTCLHHALRGALENAGIPVQHTYGNGNDKTFNGHITLSYQPPGTQERDIPFRGSWAVDRVEMWNMGGPVSMKFGEKDTEQCSCATEGYDMTEIALRDFIAMLVEGDDEEDEEKKKDKKSPRAKEGSPLLIEPDDLDTKSKEEKTPKKREFNAVGGGNVSGYTGPLGGSKKKDKRDAKAFGGGSFVNPKRKRPKWAGPGKSLV